MFSYSFSFRSASIILNFSYLLMFPCIFWIGQRLLGILKTFLGNRVPRIIDWTSFCSWCNVSGTQNLSDIARRNIFGAEHSLIAGTIHFVNKVCLLQSKGCCFSFLLEKSYMIAFFRIILNVTWKKTGSKV